MKTKIKVTAELTFEVDDHDLSESLCERLMIDEPDYQPTEQELIDEFNVRLSEHEDELRGWLEDAANTDATISINHSAIE